MYLCLQISNQEYEAKLIRKQTLADCCNVSLMADRNIRINMYKPVFLVGSHVGYVDGIVDVDNS